MDKNIIRFLTILSATTLLGCIEAPDEAPIDLPASQLIVETVESVISAWEDVKDVRLTQYARNSLYRKKIYLVSQLELRTIFHTTSKDLLGKSTADGIWISTDGNKKQQTWILSHELVHSLAYIMQWNSNDCHDDKTLFSCAGSVEQIARKYLDVEGMYNCPYKCGVSTCAK